jgi:hypothetical protein
MAVDNNPTDREENWPCGPQKLVTPQFRPPLSMTVARQVCNPVVDAESRSSLQPAADNSLLLDALRFIRLAFNSAALWPPRIFSFANS